MFSQTLKRSSALLLGAVLASLPYRAAYAQSWSTTGNTGTTAPTNFVGTVDNQAFEIHVDESGSGGTGAGSGGVMRFEPSTCNSVDCGFNLIGGKLALDGNSVTSGVVGATIFGGGESFDFAILSNVVGGDFGTISGGGENTASGGADVIAGGIGNSTNGRTLDPSLNNGGATVGGGIGNSATNEWATVPGGFLNIASGSASLAAGNLSTASGTDSVAMGSHAIAQHDGAFVFSDDSSATKTFSSLKKNTFNVRAVGGTRIVSGFSGGIASGVGLDPGSGSWASLSDRNAKANFKPVDERDVLTRLSAVPIASWNYKTQAASIRHIGPMAQDFSAAFKVGVDDKHITSVDAEGVALAAIQGLYTMIKEKDAQIAELRSRMDTLERASQAGTVRATSLNGATGCSRASVNGL
jgi:hypothetical protein